MRSRNGTGDDVVAFPLNLSGRETSLLSLYCPATGLVILPRRAEIHRSNTLADIHTYTHTHTCSSLHLKPSDRGKKGLDVRVTPSKAEILKLR